MEHESTLTARRNYASCLLHMGASDEAIAELQSLLSIYEQRSGPDHVDVLSLQADIALAYRDNGDLVEAESQLRRVINAFDEAEGQLSLPAVHARNALAIILFEQDRIDEAREIIIPVVIAQAEMFGPDHPETQVALQNLAAVVRRSPLSADDYERLEACGVLGQREDDRSG